MSRGLILASAVYPNPRRSSAPGPKFSTSTSDWAITLRNRSLPASVLRLSVRLRLLAFKIRKNRLSLFFWSRMFTRAMSPPLGSSSLMTSAPRKPRICVQAGPAWLCVMSMMRTPDNAWSMVALLLPAAAHASRKSAGDHPLASNPVRQWHSPTSTDRVRRSGLVFEDSAALHHERHLAQRGRIGKVVAAHRHYVRRHTRRNRADLAAKIERFSCERRRRDERLHRILATEL